jgi:hypothetical protein
VTSGRALSRLFGDPHEQQVPYQWHHPGGLVTAILAILHAIEPESDFAVVLFGSVQALRVILRFGPIFFASVVAILAKSTKPRGDQALDVLQALHGHKMAEHDEAPTTGSQQPGPGSGESEGPSAPPPQPPGLPPPRTSRPRRWRRPVSPRH